MNHQVHQSATNFISFENCLILNCNKERGAFNMTTLIKIE